MKLDHPERRQHGRGATLSPDNRYGSHTRAGFDDGWGSLDTPLEPLVTTLAVDTSRSVISYNTSPDVGFNRSVNPYRGCEHGCVYCFARPTHAYLDLSPGLDFESRLFYKPDAPELLRRELAAPRYECAPIALGIITDSFQPVECRLGLMRRIIEVLLEARHPFSIVTKSALIERDLGLLTEAARMNLVDVTVSVTTLRRDLARRMEPRATAPQRRLEVIRNLSAAGVPVTVLVAPLIPVLTDTELEDILGQAREAGARAAGYVLLRLPLELKEIFRDWLTAHEPLKAAHVMSRLQDTRGGEDYQAEFGTRMRGTGGYAAMIAQRFRLQTKKLGFGELPELDCSSFKKLASGSQMGLF